MPAYSQAKMGTGAGKPSERIPPAAGPTAEEKKKEEKAFKDGASRIPTPEKKYDPWGIVKESGNR
jgi:hypothetical protein